MSSLQVIWRSFFIWESPSFLSKPWAVDVAPPRSGVWPSLLLLIYHRNPSAMWTRHYHLCSSYTSSACSTDAPPPPQWFGPKHWSIGPELVEGFAHGWRGIQQWFGPQHTYVGLETVTGFANWWRGVQAMSLSWERLIGWRFVALRSGDSWGWLVEVFFPILWWIIDLKRMCGTTIVMKIKPCWTDTRQDARSWVLH